MAGGNLSPRQKMINLMYLVFIAMLAMNMSKQVLSAFGYMKESFADSSERLDNANNGILSSLEAKAEESPGRYKVKYQNAQQIKTVSDEFFNYIATVKSELTKNVKDTNDYESMDKEDEGDDYFFSKDEKYSTEGQAFVDRINGYKDEVIKILGDSINPGLKAQIEERFSTPVQKADNGRDQDWLVNRYKGFPLVTTLANLEKMQADVRTTEGEIFNSLLGGALIDETKMTNYKAIVALDKTAYFSGEQVTGSIVLGKYDKSMTIDGFESNVGGKKEAGQVLLNFKAGNPGEHPIKGSFVFNQKEGDPIRLEFDSKYTVITEPSDAVISADKMNVVYRGLQNPLSISVPGVGDANVKVSSSQNIRKVSAGKYVMTPSSGSEVNINVSAKLSSGKTVNTTKKFRIKDVPAPMGALRKETGKTSMPKESLKRAAVEVMLPDFVFDLTFAVTGFSVKVPGQPTVVVNGPRMNARAKAAIDKASRGDQVNIFDIKSKIVGEGSGLRVKKASAVLVEIK
ncbi:MAG: gliding motility protein GldM [Flavobacteriia bacterium]|nr:MAG: gliding motility protein GldM [Flavobacteriia bacterium]